jgi:hypothetical protein
MGIGQYLSALGQFFGMTNTSNDTDIQTWVVEKVLVTHRSESRDRDNECELTKETALCQPLLRAWRGTSLGTIDEIAALCRHYQQANPHRQD